MTKLITIRVFECPKCDHALRFGSSRCGRCYNTAPLKNRLTTYLALIFVLTIILSMIAR